jgi:hypothetical protein
LEREGDERRFHSLSLPLSPFRDSSPVPFWDVVVLTATDEPQAEAYRSQLAAKVKAKTIPKAQ